MNILFSPIRADQAYTASVSGDVLTIDGTAYDFSPLPAGATLPRAAVNCPWIAGDVTRDAEGVLTVPLLLPHGPGASAAARFPAPVEIDAGDLTLPE